MRTRAAMLACALMFTAWAATGAVQLKVLPGSATRGASLIVSKGCLSCHQLDQWGARRAPDLTRTPPNARSASTLAAAMWNHAPEMWRPNGNPPIVLTNPDSADLFAYFYSAFYFSLPGDAGRGRKVFEEKSCSSCHGQEFAVGKTGPPVSSWVPVNDPLDWAQRMWNHASEMAPRMAARSLKWPSLTDQDVADLIVYLGTVAPRTPTAAFRLGEPERGESVFEASCESCHSLGSSDNRHINLLEKAAPRTVTGYIAEMWNHAPRMQAANRSALPELKAGEMADLLAYLFASRYFFEPGNAELGRLVYEQKNCSRCHGDRRNEFGAPDLTDAVEFYSPITLTSGLWKHGPRMQDLMKREALSWPHFTDAEMTNLIAYLNSRLRIHTARP